MIKTQKILFTDTCNGFEWSNPVATLVEISNNPPLEYLSELELNQPGCTRMGGSWRKIMEDGKIEYTEISSGHKSDYSEDDYDTEYQLISGNY